MMEAQRHLIIKRSRRPNRSENITKMLTVSPPLFGSWALEDMINHGQNNLMMSSNLINPGETETSDSLLHFPSSHDKQQFVRNNDDDFTRFSPPENDEDKTVKKLNHNATERDRRKRVNGLYSSLRSLLPQADQMKKLSIPATVSQVLKYVPELQKELELLKEKKEGLLKKIAKHENSSSYLEKQRKLDYYSLRSSTVVSATRLSDKDIMVQISTMNCNRGSFAQLLLNLEQDGFVLQDSSSFESFQKRVFYNLHLQVQGTQVTMDLEELKEKLTNLLYEKQEEPLRLSFGFNDHLYR